METLKKYWWVLALGVLIFFGLKKRKRIKQRFKRGYAEVKMRKNAYDFMRYDIGMSKSKAFFTSAKSKRGSRYNDGSKMW